MSQCYYQWDDPNVYLEVFPPGVVLGGNEVDQDCYALVIGDPCASAYAVEGPADGPWMFAQRVSKALERTLPRNPDSAGRYVASVQCEGNSSPLDVAQELEQLVQDSPMVEVRDNATGNVYHVDLATKTVTQR